MENCSCVPQGAVWHDAWVGLGANLGDALLVLKQAIESLKAFSQIRLVQSSSFYRSAPVDAQGPDFVNAVAHIQTTLGALELLHVLQGIEQQFGRERPYYHAPRTLDLDILLYDDEVMVTQELTLPHHAMHERAFVLLPLAELDKGRVIPGRGVVKDLLLRIKDQVITRIADEV